MRLRYRIWHLLIAMTFVALWLPLSKWLLALEAMDHPNKPQSTADFIGFYLGSITLLSIPLAWIAGRMKNRKERFTAAARTSRSDV